VSGPSLERGKEGVGWGGEMLNNAVGMSLLDGVDADGWVLEGDEEG